MDTKRYDIIVSTIMQNVLAERRIANKIILWDFQEKQPMDRLYFNVAAIVADMNNEPIYVQMALIPYLKMKWKRRKTRKNLRWIGPIMAKELPNEAKTSVYVLMCFIAEFHKIDLKVFDDIQNAYYSWV